MIHADRVRQLFHDTQRELAKAVVAQEETIEQLLIACLCQGHCLLEGVSGLAKTLLVQSLAHVLGLRSSHVQFTPDLTTADLVSMTAEVPTGPLFAEFFIADELDHGQPRLQTLVLDAMQDRRVFVGGQWRALPEPFFVVATQDPTQPDVPQAAVAAKQDRFLFKIHAPFPTYERELQFIEQSTSRHAAELAPVVAPGELVEIQRRVREVNAEPDVLNLALRLARATRVHEDETPDFVLEWVSTGIGPRGVQHVVLAAKARALLRGRDSVTTEDVRSVVVPAFRHRLVTNQNARSNGITVDDVINRLVFELGLKLELGLQSRAVAEEEAAGEADPWSYGLDDADPPVEFSEASVDQQR